MKMDAEGVDKAAREMEQLLKKSDSTWLDYDRQWNLIKPHQERLTENLEALNKMEASLTPAQRKAMSDLKLYAERIAGQTHALRTVLDTKGVNIAKSPLRSDAQKLSKAAMNLAKKAEVKG